jgi:hypothetical protein
MSRFIKQESPGIDFSSDSVAINIKSMLVLYNGGISYPRSGEFPVLSISISRIRDFPYMSRVFPY